MRQPSFFHLWRRPMSTDGLVNPPERGSSAPDPGTAATLPPAEGKVTATLPPAPSTDGPLPIPERVSIPGYEVLRELGRGGMGVVYQARHLRLNRLVALKMILSGGHASEADLVRFLHEAEAVAQLQHPHIVQIFETGQHQNLPYFTLEFVGGGSLHSKLAGTPLQPAAGAKVVEQLA